MSLPSPGLHLRGGFENPSKRSIPFTSLLDLNVPFLEPGKYLLISIEGQMAWPGVVCDCYMVENYLKHRRKPEIRALPMLYLGTTEFRWVKRRYLRELSDDLLIEERNAATDQLLKSAYEDIFNGRNLDDWKHDVSARLLEDACKGKPIDASKSKQKRKQKTLADGKEKYCNWNEDDSEIDHIQSTTKRSKLKRERGISVLDCIALYKDSESEGNLSNHHISKALAEPLADSMKPRNATSSDMTSIYIGNPYKIFPVKLSSLQQSPLLQGSLKSQGNEFYIMNPILSDLDAQQFVSIAEYLNHSEYSPKLLERGTIDERLENVSSKKMRSDVLVQCGLLYKLAGKLQLPQMQDLCFQKLKAIKNPPVPELLTVVRLLFPNGHNADDLIHDYVVSYFSEHYYEIWEAESDEFLAVLKEYRGLARSVHERMGRAPKVKVEVTEIKKKDKVEKKPSIKKET